MNTGVVLQQPRSRLVAFLVALLLAALPTFALAKKKPRKDGIHKLVDDGAKAVKASKAQKLEAHASEQDVIRSIEDAFGPMTGSLPEQNQVYALFVAPTVDRATLDAIRARRDALDGKVADSLVVAFQRIHHILDAKQRATLVDWARQKLLGKKQKNLLKQKLMTGVINLVVEGVMEQIGAAEPERVVVRQVRDQVLDAVKTARGDHVEMCDQLGAIFTAPEVDKVALEQFRQQHEHDVQALLVVLEQAFLDLHAGLTPEHRGKLVALVQNQSLAASKNASDTDDSDNGFQ
ncbi:MAG: hypothetical protein ABI321_02950 [Polyangia bacterium]